MLREEARAENVSLNEYCVHKLAVPLGPFATRGATTEAIERAASCFGEDLIAVVAFGSWARGESSEASDVDLLIVVNDRVELRRDLYEVWDRAAPDVKVEGSDLDVHIAHLPDPERFSPSVWGEIAIDGIILFERERLLSTRLARVRRRIAEGELTRRVAAGGQPYWVDLRAPPATETPLSHRNL